MNKERAELIPVMKSQIAHEYKCSNCGEYYIVQTYSLHLPKECKCGCKLDLIQDEWLKELENEQKNEQRERAKEILKDLNKHEVIMFENTNNEAESKYTNVELHQALDIAIDSLNIDWVDVRDRLPSDYGEYIVQIKNGEIDIDEWQDKPDEYMEYEFKYHNIDEVIAWKPLPQPYERKE